MTDAPECKNDSATCTGIDAGLTQPGSPSVLGWTYFISDGERIKIGFSERPRRRILGIGSTLGKDLKTLAVVPTSIAGEFETHQRFAHLKIRGEWFRPEPDLLQFIELVKAEADNIPKRPRPVISHEFAKIRGDLIAKRVVHGAKSAVGFRCSNLVKQIDNRADTTEEAKIELEKFMQQQVADLARLCAP